MIGAGYMAEEHLKAFADIPQVKVLGIHSRSRSGAELLAAKFSIPHVCDSTEELYKKTMADLVVVAVPELAVNDVCKFAFKYPWQLLVEKPVGYNIQDAENISDAAALAGRKAYVALNRRHFSSTRAVLEKLSSLQGQRLVQVLDQENPNVALEGGQPSLVVENWMYSNSIHIIDLLRVFCRGRVEVVERIVKWDPIKPNFVVAKVAFSSGDIGIYQAVWNAPGPWSVSVNTQSNRWEMRPLEMASVQAYKDRRTESIPVHEWDIKFKAGIRLQAEEAVKAVRGESHNLPSLEDGLATMKLVQQIYAQ